MVISDPVVGEIVVDDPPLASPEPHSAVMDIDSPPSHSSVPAPFSTIPIIELPDHTSPLASSPSPQSPINHPEPSSPVSPIQAQNYVLALAATVMPKSSIKPPLPNHLLTTLPTKSLLIPYPFLPSLQKLGNLPTANQNSLLNFLASLTQIQST
ncbi:hypothetical protein Rs2_39119 [Raphanus sativus]|nr:hypothetical protein Rs2_39119 [Raphanus sativus]